MHEKWKSLSCVHLCDPMEYTVHGILQARILEWVAIPFSRGPSQPRDRTQVSHIAGGFFTSWATKKAQECWLVGSLSLLQWIFPLRSRASQSLRQDWSDLAHKLRICHKMGTVEVETFPAGKWQGHDWTFIAGFLSFFVSRVNRPREHTQAFEPDFEDIGESLKDFKPRKED